MENLIYQGQYLYNKKWNGKGYDENGNIIIELINGNGKYKEFYDNGKLKFEGEYLNGKRHGKGKEYFKVGEWKSVDFEGEYLNGKRWNGKVKDYYDYDKLKFEGEYLNGEINGKCKEFYSNGKLKIESEYMNGKMLNGKGYDKNGNIAFEIKMEKVL